MAVTLWVPHKSAHLRLIAGAELPAGISPARLAMCEMGILEWLYSTRSAREFDAQNTELRATFDVLAAPDDIFERVFRLQSDLAHYRGMWHRRAIGDLFIAEVARFHGAGVLHADSDFALIAKVRPDLALRTL